MEEEYFDEIFDLESILPDHDQMIYNTSTLLISNYSNDNITRQPETYLDHHHRNIITTNDNTNTKGKQVMMMNSSDFSQEIIRSTKPSSSSASDSNSQILFSFQNYPKPFIQEIENPAVPSQIINFSSSSENGKSSEKEYCGGAVRNTLQAQEHVMAERKRRQKLGQLFISLSKTVPGIKKLDKASLLEDAINYTKSLQQRLSILEKEHANNKTTSINESTDDFSINDENFDKGRCTGNESEATAGSRIKVRVSNKSVLIKIWCKKQKEIMSTIELEMEKMNLSLLDIRVMPFGSSSLDITILAQLQVHSEFSITAKDIVERLEMANFLKPDT